MVRLFQWNKTDNGLTIDIFDVDTADSQEQILRLLNEGAAAVTVLYLNHWYHCTRAKEGKGYERHEIQEDNWVIKFIRFGLDGTRGATESTG